MTIQQQQQQQQHQGVPVRAKATSCRALLSPTITIPYSEVTTTTTFPHSDTQQKFLPSRVSPPLPPLPLFFSSTSSDRQCLFSLLLQNRCEEESVQRIEELETEEIRKIDVQIREKMERVRELITPFATTTTTTAD